jgi:hypothetical protein
VIYMSETQPILTDEYVAQRASEARVKHDSEGNNSHDWAWRQEDARRRALKATNTKTESEGNEQQA